MMNEYSISVSNGKVIGDSAFFRIANDLLEKECQIICDFTDLLDHNPEQKKDRIAEYKCAKYRYAAVSVIHMALIHNNRCRKEHNLEATHYLLLPYDLMFKAQTDALSQYETAPENEKPDYSLYYGMLAFTENELSERRELLPNASDWESVELEERIGGLLFVKECLYEAWQKRKDVTA